MRKILLGASLAVLASLATETQAQTTHQWSRTLVQGSNFYGNTPIVTTDMDRNVYVVATSHYSNTFDFDPSSSTLTLGPTSNKSALLKYNAAGTLLWVKESNMYITEMTYANGHLIIGGRFTGTVDLDMSSNVSTYVSSGNYDGFVCKVDTSAALVWGNTFDSPSQVYVASLTADGAGAVYVAVKSDSIADVDPSANIANTTAGKASLIKYNSDGTFNWVQNQGCEYSSSIKYSNNALYSYTGTDTSFTLPGGIDITVPNTQSFAVVISKHSPSTGNADWGYNIGAPVDFAYFVAAGPNRVIIATDGYSTFDYDPSAGVAEIDHANGDIVLVSLDAAGNFQSAWPTGSYYNQPTAGLIDHNNEFYAVLYVQDTFDIDFTAGTNLMVSPSANLLVKYNSNGSPAWYSDLNDKSRAEAMTLDNQGNIILAGLFDNNLVAGDTCDMDWGSGTSFEIVPTNANDKAHVFVTKYSHNGAVAIEEVSAKTFAIFPNPASHSLNLQNAAVGATLRVTDALGRVVLSQVIQQENSEINTSDLTNGVYFFSLQAGNQQPQTQKVIIAK